ncbi:MAG: Tetratricopeptide 2 repeat protein [Verrucomicrobiaceae bacterium]|nr:Tetratricopeptide 2 repeat protein [Verrucomicrobiaceae bacterium]
MKQPAHDLTVLISGVALLLLTAIVYYSALPGSFQFDDFNVIVNNAKVHSWSAWRAELPSMRPLLKLSYLGNWLLDARPWGFHLFNVCCHAVNVLLVLALGRQLFAAQPDGVLIAIIAAAIFALHPAQTEAVTYISGRSITLMGTFYLGSLVAGCSGYRALRLVVSPLLFAAALLTKEIAWTLPLALLLINYLRVMPARENVLRVVPHALVGLAVVVLFFFTPAYQRLFQHSISIRPLLDNLALQVDGWFYLITRPLLLLQTNIDPELPAHPLFSTFWFAQLLVLFIVLLLALQWRQLVFGFGLLWFLLQLLPTNSLLPRNDIANDRQLYLALLGPAWMLASGLVTVVTQKLIIPFATLLMVSLGIATMTRNRDYLDEIQLWQSTADQSPTKARVWNNLGYAYQLAGFSAEARVAYQHALHLDPDMDRARINLLLLEPIAAPAK